MTASAIERPGNIDASASTVITSASTVITSASTVITLADYQQAVGKKALSRKAPATSERATSRARRLLAKRKEPLPRDNWAAIRVLEHLRRIGIAPVPAADYTDQPPDLDGGD